MQTLGALANLWDTYPLTSCQIHGAALQYCYCGHQGMAQERRKEVVFFRRN